MSNKPPIIIASDGSGSALAAMSAARELASVSGSPVRLVSVIEPYSQVTDTPDVVSWPFVPAGQAPVAREEQVRAEYRAVGGDADKVDLDVDVGNPGAVLARAAHDAGASLIVTGFGRHAAEGRLLGGETLIDLTQVTDIPLLATTSFNWKAQRILIAVDSGIPGLTSAGIPTELFAAARSVYCVHVMPQRVWSGHAERSGVPHPQLDLENEIPGRLRTLYSLPADVLVQGITLTGDPAREVLDFARRFSIDLIVVGRRQRNLLQRMFSDGVSARILRRSPCPVLLLPPATRQGDLRTLTSTDPLEWPALLNQVSERDVGRRVQMEIDDLEFGAQFEARSFRLAGVAYDHKDERVEVMLGGVGSSARHLAHSLGGVTSVDLLFRTDGTDEALRIAYGGGQMLLTFMN